MMFVSLSIYEWTGSKDQLTIFFLALGLIRNLTFKEIVSFLRIIKNKKSLGASELI